MDDDLGIMQSCEKRKVSFFSIMKTFILYMQIVKVLAFNLLISHNTPIVFLVYVKWRTHLSHHHLVAEPHAKIIL